MLTKKEKLRKTYKAFRSAFRRRDTAPIPVFIFGEMRSGTNMLVECLDRSPDTDIFNETDDDAFHGYALRSLDVLERLVENSFGTHTVFKALADSARSVVLLDHFPSSKGIWIYRHFHDVVNSSVRKWKDHNRYLHDILYDSDRAHWRAMNLSNASLELISAHYHRGLSEESARALIWYIRNRTYFERALDKNPDVRLLSYESLVTEPVKQLKEIFAFIKLHFDAKYVSHVSARSVSRFAAPEIDAQILALCEELKSALDRALQMQMRLTGG